MSLAVTVAPGNHVAMSDGEEMARWQARCLDARLCHGEAQPPPELRDACAAWLREVMPADGRQALGLSPVGVTNAWREVLGWAGMPLASGGALRWGVDVRQADVRTPQQEGDTLVLPDPAILRTVNGISLKPMRQFVAKRLGCRLLGAPGIRLWLWPKHAVVHSMSDMPLAGFVYGDVKGHRATMALLPYAAQVITW
ncbi:MAG: hypothetical protein AAB263_08635 [Planctomycetota bacterium]